MTRLFNALGWLLVAILFGSQLWLFRNFSIDDAFITFRYVRQFVAGNGLVFNLGERVEGYSNFLWVMLLAPMHALGMDLLFAARLLAIALSIGTVLLTYQLARKSRWPILAPILLASCAPFAVWTMGGLETPLFSFLLTASAYTFVREEEQGRGFTSGLLLALLALTRPEGLMFAVVATGFRAWRLLNGSTQDASAETASQKTPGERVLDSRFQPVHHSTGTSRRSQVSNLLKLQIQPQASRLQRHDWLRLIAFGTIFIPYFAWRLSYYGDPLPNTVYAKSLGLHPRALVEGVYYLGNSVIALGGVWFLAIPVAMIVLKGRTIRHLFLLACVAAYALVILAGGGDWMPMQRLLVHVLPLIIVLAHAGLILLADSFAMRWQRIVATALALSQSAFLLFGALNARFVEGIGRPGTPQGLTMVDYLRAKVEAGDTFAVTDAGGLSYALPLGVRVVDMFGLTDAYIARLTPQFPSGLLGQGDGFGKWDVDYVLAQNPRFIQVHVMGRAPDGTLIVDNTSNRLLVNDPRFKAGYRQVADTPELRGLFEKIS